MKRSPTCLNVGVGAHKIFITTGVYLTRGPASQGVGLGGRPRFEVIRHEPWLPHIYIRRRRLSRWRKSVEAPPPGQPAMWLGHPASTWHQTNLSKSVEVSFTPKNTPLMVKVNTPHSFCSSPLVKIPDL
jgi:hypothetical protein